MHGGMTGWGLHNSQTRPERLTCNLPDLTPTAVTHCKVTVKLEALHPFSFADNTSLTEPIISPAACLLRWRLHFGSLDNLRNRLLAG